MANCKKCIHYNRCSSNGKKDTEYMGKEVMCDNVEDLCKLFVSRCPKCNSNLITKGCAFKLSTPHFIRKIRQMHGITCVMCGYSQATIKRWNKAGADND